LCDFVTATLPKSADLARLAPIFEHHGFVIQPMLDSSAARRLPDELYFRPTRAYCDCGTVLGSARHANTPEEAAERSAAEVARLEKQGWSAAKIARRQAQRNAEPSRAHKRQTDRETEAQRWLALLSEVLATARIDHLGLMVHWYNGSLDTADLPKGKPRRVPLKNASLAFLRGMEDGVLYRFVAAER
jgi:hypothetical protein